MSRAVKVLSWASAVIIFAILIPITLLITFLEWLFAPFAPFAPHPDAPQ